MPLTWFAHQVPALGLKAVRPRWVDATAMCLGSTMPDLLYAVSASLGIDTHKWPAFTYGLVPTVVLAYVVRHVLAPALAPQLPDLGVLRLRSYAVLDRRRPPIAITVVSATAGIASHLVLDWFTHPGRPGVRRLGYDDVEVRAFGHVEPLAGVFQLIGHSLGSLAALAGLAMIGRRRLLERWYGDTAVAAARASQPALGARLLAVSGVSIGLLLGAVWGVAGERVETIQRTFLGGLAGATVAAAALRRGAARGDATRCQNGSVLEPR